MRYLDFDLEVGPGTGRSYPMVVRSAAGDPRSTMQFPYDELALKDLRIALLQSSQTHRVLTEEEQAVQAFGQQLFAALFAGVAGNLFYASRTKATQERLLGVRLRPFPRPRRHSVREHRALGVLLTEAARSLR